MPITLENVIKSTINQKNCEQVEQQILDVLNKSNLNLRELICVLAQLLIDCGGTIEKIKENLRYDDMWRRYSVNPTLGNALMAFGTDVLSDWLKIPETRED